MNDKITIYIGFVSMNNDLTFNILHYCLRLKTDYDEPEGELINVGTNFEWKTIFFYLKNKILYIDPDCKIGFVPSVVCQNKLIYTVKTYKIQDKTKIIEIV